MVSPLPRSASGKESAHQRGRHKRRGLGPWMGQIPWRRAWQPTPVFVPGESPWTEEPGRLQPMGSQRAGHNRATKHSTAQYRQPPVNRQTELIWEVWRVHSQLMELFQCNQVRKTIIQLKSEKEKF